MADLAAYVLTLNEEAHIARALESIFRLTNKVLVVDSGSTDRTCQIAQDHGASVAEHPFSSYSKQRDWALSQLRQMFTPEWILVLDADEWLDEALIADIELNLSAAGDRADIFLMHLQVHFDGRQLRWGGFDNTWLPRLFRSTAAGYEERSVNEHLAVDTGAIIAELSGRLMHADVDSWDRYIAKHNGYSSLEAIERVALCDRHDHVPLQHAVRQRFLRRRWLREQVWRRLPARPAVRFLQLYVLMGGMFDGRAGFHRALFEAWQEMCVDLKVRELNRAS